MRMCWIVAATLALAELALAEPALAQAVTKIDTELVKGRCRFLADDGEVGHYALKRCPGLAGSRVYITAGVHDVVLSFRWGRAKPVDVFDRGSVGTKLEWRGTRDKQGFKPHAVLVELVMKEPDDDKTHNAWGVIRMERRNACLMAVVDQAANKDALALARATADAQAPGAACARIEPKIVGAQTLWAKRAVGAEKPPE